LGREEVERMDRAAFNAATDESKDAERPAGDQGLPTVSNPGARMGVNYGGGSQEAKDAREKAASRRREQQRVREAAVTYQRPTQEQADRFHTALLTPLRHLGTPTTVETRQAACGSPRPSDVVIK
jgi:hypothetical protein